MNIPTDPCDLENFVFQGDKSNCFPEATTYSLPIFTKRSNRVFQAAFLYNQVLDAQNTFPRPFAWALLPLDDSLEYLFGWCAAQDFVATAEYPLNSRVNSFFPGKDLPEEVLHEHQLELSELFEKMIKFAFCPEPAAEEQEMINRYKDLFLILCPQGQYPYYQALAPDFFDWIGLVLSSGLQPDLWKSDEKQILHLVQELARQFREKIAQDFHKERLFDEIHEELQNYKTGAHEEITHTMARDVISIIDAIQKNVHTLQEEPPTPSGYQHLMDLFLGVEQDLTDLLYRQGIDPYSTEGTQVEVTRQKILAVEPTADPLLDKTVAEHLALGWEKNGLIIRPEYVRAYLFRENAKELLANDQQISGD